ncbi:unnamed protein product [Closterium sp. NIES-53]
MGPPHFNPRMASASQAPVGFLPVVRPKRASIFSPSCAPGVRCFRARRAPMAHDGLLFVVRPADARAAPAPPPRPPLCFRCVRAPRTARLLAAREPRVLPFFWLTADAPPAVRS